MKATPPDIEYDYSTIIPIRMVVCVGCGHRKKYCAKDMCSVCYIAIRNNKKKKITHPIF